MSKKKIKHPTDSKRKYCEVEPKECDGKCCYSKGNKRA